MSFAAPFWLWLLVPLLPLLWWLSQPPAPRRHVFTAHLQQWQAAMHALRRRPPRGSALRLLLLAAAATAAVLAAARPVLPGAAGMERLVVLLDASASMAARCDDGSSAFERARTRLRTVLAGVPEHVELTVLRCGGDLVRRHGASARSLQDLGGPAGALGVDLVALASAAASRTGTAVWTLTDGQGQQQLPAHGALTRFDAAGPNAAITAVRLDDAWPLPGLKVEVDVVCHAATRPADGALRASLEVTGAVARPASVELTVRPGEATTVPLELERSAAGGRLSFEVALAGDRLPPDDRFALSLPPLPAPRIAVLVEGESGPFAEVAAETLAAEVGGSVVAPDSGERVGLLLVDGGRVAIDPGETRALTFGTRLDAGEPDSWLAPGPLEWSRSSPLTAGLDLSELTVARAWRQVLPPVGEPLLWVGEGEARTPLAVVCAAADDVASVHFAFRLQDSNLPLLAAFPQLLRRAYVRSYGATAAARPETRPPAPGEIDLSRPATGADRELPRFCQPDRELARWFVLAGLLALVVRAFAR